MGLRRTFVAVARALSIRRLLSIVSLILLFSTLAILFSPTNPVESVTRLNPDISGLKPKLGNPFGSAVHKPGIDNSDVASSPASSSAGGASKSDAKAAAAAPATWFGSSWWHNPFSSSIATAADRIALPMLEERCMVYAYHDADDDRKLEAAEDRLLLAWRRAWWANGFMPVVLGQAEAKANPLWQKLEAKEVSSGLKKELMRWLAWGSQGRGALVNHRIIPMGPLNDDTLVALRKCSRFDSLTRYEEFAGKLYSSDRASIEEVLNYVLSSSSLEKANTIEEALSSSPDAAKMMKVAPFPKSLADYTSESVSIRYGKVTPDELPNLINSHLHSTFLGFYSDGIEYLTPFASKLSALHQPAIVLAHRLAHCPVKSDTAGCPPNNPRCTPCNKRAAISSRPNYQNSSSTFVIGVVPHPYTTVQLTTSEVSLSNTRKDRVIRYIRRKLQRDPWVRKVTEEIFDNHNVGPQPRVVKMKEVIVAPPVAARVGLWGTETGGFKDVEWSLGFALPTLEELKLQLPPVNKKEETKLAEAVKAIAKCKGSAVCRALEAWCLADTELWNFANAWAGRKEAVRMKWSKEEKKFGKGMSEDER